MEPLHTILLCTNPIGSEVNKSVKVTSFEAWEELGAYV